MDRLVLRLQKILELIFWNNTLGDWGYAFCLFALLLLGVLLTKRLLLARLEKFAKWTKVKWDDTVVDMLGRTRLWMLVPAMLAIVTHTLALPFVLKRAMFVAAVIGVALQAMIYVRVAVDAGIEAVLRRSTGRDGQPDSAIASSVGVFRVIVMFVFGVIVVLVALDNMEVKVTPMLTGLGIGGIAIALAVQNILGDLFASFTILLDKPFEVGDFIVVGTQMGTVEKIGIKTTRVRALSGEQLIFANTALLTSTVQNFKRMQTRRAVFTVGVVYETPPAKLRAIPRLVREAIEREQLTRFDRCHLLKFGSYSLDYETVYTVMSSDFNKYADIQQSINLSLFERFAAEGIEFAYPTQVEIFRNPPPEDHPKTSTEVR